MTDPKKILIVDDHPIFYEGIRNALRPYARYKVVACLRDGKDLVANIQKFQPDILLLDINLPGKNGIMLISELKQLNERPKIIVLSMYLPTDIQMPINETEIDGYIIKHSGTDILLEALDAVGYDRFFLDPNIRQINNHSDDPFSRKLKLSSREIQIIELLKQGLTNKEISEKLFLSDLTVKTHRKNIMSKMGAKNVVDLLRMI